METVKANAYKILKERGFIYQSTDDEAISRLLDEKAITCYVGFDATADSLHVGSLVPIMGLAHMQRCGHRPIALLGGGTTLVGDPSGKTELRQMLSVETVQSFGKAIKAQLGRYLDFENDRALLLNNADWLLPLNYIEFLRDVGRHFSVNRMLTAESYKQRLETGLTFIEFNYMLLQAYDFYVLAKNWDCMLQMGGQDQWGNIVAGSDLIRRKMGDQAYGMTFPLLLSSSGQKFGKTEAGAVWLDAKRTPVFEFYQFWRNVEDRDVEKLLGLFTMLPMEEVRRLGGLKEPLINRAKEILAFEATRFAHGINAAIEAYTSAVTQFGEADPENRIETSSEIRNVRFDKAEALPTISLDIGLLKGGLWVVKLFVESGLCTSNGEAKRLIRQGGAYIQDEKVEDENLEIKETDLQDGSLIIRAGKKRYKRLIFS
jgi:tyrosyl-tRNA synthetase